MYEVLCSHCLLKYLYKTLFKYVIYVKPFMSLYVRVCVYVYMCVYTCMCAFYLINDNKKLHQMYMECKVRDY